MIEGVKLIECKLTRAQKALKQLPLAIQYCFKLLYSLSLSCQNKVMFHGWQSNKVANPIVSLNAVQMMYNPPSRQGFAMCVFPNYNMLKNSIVFCSRMARVINPNITVRIQSPSPSPVVMFTSTFANSAFLHTAYTYSPSSFLFTTIAPNRVTSNWLTTIYTIILYLSFAIAVLPSPFCRAMMAIATLYAVATSFTYSHNNYILSYGASECNY